MMEKAVVRRENRALYEVNCRGRAEKIFWVSLRGRSQKQTLSATAHHRGTGFVAPGAVQGRGIPRKVGLCRLQARGPKDPPIWRRGA